MTSKSLAITGAVMLISLLAACRGVDTYDGSSDGRGEVTLHLTDSPVDGATAVNITVTAVEVKPVNEPDPISVTLEPAVSVNLLNLQDGETEELLDQQLLAIGNYEWVRLVLDSSVPTIVIEGSEYDLPVPAGAEDGLEIPINFSVEEDSEFDFTIDFDVRKSVAQVSDGTLPTFELLPSLRIVQTERAATISGRIANSLVNDSRCENTNINRGNAVYVFSGAGATVQDLQRNDSDPVATATVERDVANDRYEYSVGFLEPGTYTAVFTCDGDIDVLDEDNEVNMHFSNTQEVTLDNGGMETVNFDD